MYEEVWLLVGFGFILIGVMFLRIVRVLRNNESRIKKLEQR